MGTDNKINFKNKFEIIRDMIREDILNGHYAPGTNLPPEEKLTETYGINRGTISKAISSLTTEGLIVRKPRTGSKVLEIKDRKLASRLGVLTMITSGHVFGKLFRYLSRTILENHFFPVTIDQHIFGEAENEKFAQHFEGHCEDLVNANPEFFLVDGVVTFPFEVLKKYEERIKNLVFINRIESRFKFKGTHILSDYEQGGYLVASHLLESGDENMLFASASKYSPSFSEQILEGVKKAFLEKGKTFGKENIIHTKDNDDLLVKKILEKFDSKQKPRAIFATQDSRARRVQWALDQQGLKAGKDYRLIGYLNTPWATNFDPPMTSVSIGEEKIVEKFGEILAERKFKNQTFMIEPELKIRET